MSDSDFDIEIRSFDEIPKSKRNGLYAQIYDKLMNAIVKGGKKTVGAKFPDRSRAIGFYNWSKDALASDSVAGIKGVGVAMRTLNGEVWVFFYVP